MKKLALLVLVLLSTGLMACGGSDDSTTAADTTSEASAPAATPPAEKLPLLDDGVYDSRIRYAADPGGTLAYNVSEASASAGKATLQFVNPQSTVHNVALEDENGKTIGATKKIGKGITTTNVVVKPGVYLAYCSVPGHRKAGMVGHLTVR
jgi:plastocyanin